jgi:ABC-type branched-subunit amino acid transport system ATPase component/ABC-type branched-subunit amino acid transport system permease subunit
VNIGEDQLIIMAVSLVAMLLLSAFLKFSRVGLGLRAVVDNPDLVNCSGRNPRALRRLAWIIGCTFAALSGVLLAIAPSFGPDSGQVGRLIIPAFAAAAVGYFTNLPLVYVGALAIGIASSVLTRYVTASWLLALPPSVPVVVLLGALMVTPTRRLTERWRTTHVVTRPPRPGRRVALAGSVALFVVLGFTPTWAGFEVNIYTTALVYVLIFLSLGMLVRESGQLSLCHLGLAAIGATTFARFATNLGLPWAVAAIGAALVTAIVGALVAITAIRLSGVFLALATLAFGYILQQFFYGTDLMFGSSVAIPAPRPFIGTRDSDYYYVVLGIVAATSVFVVVLDRTRMGRLLRGMADSPVALQAQGATVNVTKLVVFALSAFLAGLAGALLTSLDNVTSSAAFSATDSLVIVAVLFVLPVAEPWYAVAAAIVYYLLPVKLNVSDPASWTSFVFGAVSVVSVLVIVRRADLAHRRRRRDQPARLHAPSEVAVLPVAHATARARAASASVEPGLDMTGISVRFGGIVALDRVDLSAPIGRITGLIGPNGAGKTTLFNVSSGIIRPAAGRVRLRGRDLSRLGPAARARRGLGRTFQQPQLFEGMTVGQTVALGREASLAGCDPWAQLTTRKGDRAIVAAAVDEALRLTGLWGLRDAPLGALSTGERRLVELARCLAGPFDVILLDEPSAGLDRNETTRIDEVLRSVVATRNVGVLLVEHDMALVMDICNYVYVIDFGRVIFDGTPREVMNSVLVRSAYLGEGALSSEA